MKIRMSPNIAVRSAHFAAAVDFYGNVLGFHNRSTEPELVEFDAYPITFFVDDDAEFSGPILELFVDDVEEAREYLVKNGCKVVRWRGKGQDCYIKDPFGVIYNLWED